MIVLKFWLKLKRELPRFPIAYEMKSFASLSMSITQNVFFFCLRSFFFRISVKI